MSPWDAENCLNPWAHLRPPASSVSVKYWLSHHREFPSLDFQAESGNHTEMFTCWCLPHFKYGWESFEHFQHSMSLWLRLFCRASRVMFNKATNKGMQPLTYSGYQRSGWSSSYVREGEGRCFSDLGQAPHIFGLFDSFLRHGIFFVSWCPFYCNLSHLLFTHSLGVCWKPWWLLVLKGQFVFFLLSGIATGMIARYMHMWWLLHW